jgi:hypothetical protein
VPRRDRDEDVGRMAVCHGHGLLESPGDGVVMITEVAPVDGVLEGSTVRNIPSAVQRAWECDSKQASVLESEAMGWRTSVHGVASVRLNWARRAADLQKATSAGSEEQEMVMGRCRPCSQPRQAGEWSRDGWASVEVA